MTDKQTQGLFLVGSLPGSTDNVSYCRIIEATVLTTQAPQMSRLLTYKVGYWSTEPDPAQAPHIYTDHKTGYSSFGLKLALNCPSDLDTIQAMATNHFLSLVLTGKPLRDAGSVEAEMISVNNGLWSYHSLDDSIAFAVFQMQHRAAFRAVDGEALGTLYSELSYQARVSANKNVSLAWGNVTWTKLPAMTLSTPYTTQIEMMAEASNHFQQADTQTAYVAAIVNQLKGQ